MTMRRPASQCGTRAKARGTSLVELLVVIVVFLIGILALVQIFPGGFAVMLQTRNQSVAQHLDKALIEQASGQADSIPEQILPVAYDGSGANVAVSATSTIDNAQYAVLGDAVDANGIVSSGGNPVGYWPYVSGPNVMRRIVGESHVVPSPRSVGADFGSLLSLRYGPILTTNETVSGKAYRPLADTNNPNGSVEVYGDDLVNNPGAPPANGSFTDYEIYLDQADSSSATLYVPRSAAATGADPRDYRVQVTLWVKDSSNNITRRDVTVSSSATSTTFPSIDSNPAGGFVPLSIATIANLAAQSLTLDSVEAASIRVSRKFNDVTATDFTKVAGKPTRAYEYKVLQPAELGMLLFSPAGENVVEQRPDGRRPLNAHITYDVLDWRILKDDFRFPSDSPRQFKLTIDSLSILGHPGPDGLATTGLGFSVPDGSGGTASTDFLLVDVESGAICLPASYSVDRSGGVVSFASNTLQVVYPGAGAATTLDATGRSLRAYYMGRLNWSAQVLKAASSYGQAYGAPGPGQYYVGGSSGIGGAATRLYFPYSDARQKVKVGTIFYISTDPSTAATTKVVARDVDFLLNPGSDLGYPYLDITQIDPNATSLDTATNGYSAADVKGVSLTARAMWNTSSFHLGADSALNLQALDHYRQRYSAIRLDTIVQRGVSQ